MDIHLGILVARARKALRREFEARIAIYDLTVPQVAVLSCLWDADGQTIGQLSRTVCSDGPTLTSLLDRLAAKGLICRKRDPKDRRTVRIWLEDAGRSLSSDVMGAADEVIAIARSGMTQEQLNQLSSLLVLLCETMEQATETRFNEMRFCSGESGHQPWNLQSQMAAVSTSAVEHA